MLMKQHILAALREELGLWDERLAGLDGARAEERPAQGEMSVKDVLAHLRAWQQRTIARLEAALESRDPVFPDWSAAGDPEAEDATGAINAWIERANRDRPWAAVHQEWRDGYARFLELAEAVSERDLLDSTRYAWLGERPLALVLIASYDHHQEHLETLPA